MQNMFLLDANYRDGFAIKTNWAIITYASLNIGLKVFKCHMRQRTGEQFNALGIGVCAAIHPCTVHTYTFQSPCSSSPAHTGVRRTAKENRSSLLEGIAAIFDALDWGGRQAE